MSKRNLFLAAAGVAILVTAGAGAHAAQTRAAATAPTYANVAEAARANDWTAVKAMAKPGADLNVLSIDGSTALHFAIAAGETDSVKALLDAGADIKKQNLIGVTPLKLAIGAGDSAMAGLLIDRGADAQELDTSGETFLMLAARYGTGELAQVLIDKGVDVNAIEPTFGNDATMIAVRENNLPVLAALIKAGAELNHQTPAGPPPITRPQGDGGGSHGDGIAKSGIPPEGQRLTGIGLMTPLMYAARDGRTEAADMLIKAGAKIELAEYNQITPLLMAVTNDHHDTAKVLIAAGADVNAADWYGREPLWATVESRNRDVNNGDAKTNGVDRDAAMDVIKLLVEKGADVNAQTKYYPPRMGHHSFDVSWVNFVGETPLIRASINNDLPLMQYLLDHGADHKIKTNTGNTAFMAAAGLNYALNQTFVPNGEPDQLKAVQMLWNRGGIDINEVNTDMRLGAIQGALNRKSPNVVAFLVEHGARLDMPDEQGRLPLAWANGVFLTTNAPEASPEIIAQVEKYLAEGKGVGPDWPATAARQAAERGGAPTAAVTPPTTVATR